MKKKKKRNKKATKSGLLNIQYMEIHCRDQMWCFF